MRPYSLAALALTLATPLHADDVSDRISGALAAYEAGDLKTTTSELAAATTALNQKKGAMLEAALPAAPGGWTREISTDYAAGLAMAGGGTGAEARYSGPEGQGVTLNYTMDSPLMAMMMGMFATEQMMAMMGKVVEVNGQKMLDQDNSMMVVIDGRILVQINGAETAQLIPLAETIDWAALAAFDAAQ